MAIKRILSKEEYLEAPEGLNDAYVEQDDGSWVLDIEPDPIVVDQKKKIDEFRATNRSLRKKVEEMQGGSYQATKVAERLSELEQQYTELKEEKRIADEQLRRNTLKDKLALLGRRMGLQQGATDDILRRAEIAGFTVKNEVAVMEDGEGRVVTINGTPATLSGWLAEQRNGEASHLFREPQGAGEFRVQNTSVKQDATIIENPTHQQVADNIDRIARGEIVLRQADSVQI